MAAKTNWHRYATKLHHCHRMYFFINQIHGRQYTSVSSAVHTSNLLDRTRTRHGNTANWPSALEGGHSAPSLPPPQLLFTSRTASRNQLTFSFSYMRLELSLSRISLLACGRCGCSGNSRPQALRHTLPCQPPSIALTAPSSSPPPHHHHHRYHHYLSAAAAAAAAAAARIHLSTVSATRPLY